MTYFEGFIAPVPEANKDAYRKHAADAAVLHGRVSDVAGMVSLSRRTMTNIHQNITMALGLKAVFLVTTIAGITGLWPAILADTGATVLVTMNALRLLRAKAG